MKQSSFADLEYSHAVQFVRPEVAIEFDVDSEQAIVAHQKNFQYAAESKLWIGGAHMPSPGLRHVRAEKEGYSWVSCGIQSYSMNELQNLHCKFHPSPGKVCKKNL